MIIDIATAEDIAALAVEIRALRSAIELMQAALPPTLVSLRNAAKQMGVDPRTVAAMLDRGDIRGRRAGRKILIDATSIMPVSAEKIAELARKARR